MLRFFRGNAVRALLDSALRLDPSCILWFSFSGDQVMEHAIVGGAITPGDALRAISERVNCRSLSLGKWLHKHLASQKQGYNMLCESFKTEDVAQGQASAPNIA